MEEALSTPKVCYALDSVILLLRYVVGKNNTLKPKAFGGQPLAKSLSGVSWPGLSWPSLSRLSVSWPGLSWRSLSWLSFSWPSFSCATLLRPGASWPVLSCVLAHSGLACPVARPHPRSPGASWPGLCCALALPGLSFSGASWPGLCCVLAPAGLASPASLAPFRASWRLLAWPLLPLGASWPGLSPPTGHRAVGARPSTLEN